MNTLCQLRPGLGVLRSRLTQYATEVLVAIMTFAGIKVSIALTVTRRAVTNNCEPSSQRPSFKISERSYQKIIRFRRTHKTFVEDYWRLDYSDHEVVSASLANALAWLLT